MRNYTLFYTIKKIAIVVPFIFQTNKLLIIDDKNFIRQTYTTNGNN